MKKTIALLAVLIALGGLLLAGWRWLASSPPEPDPDEVLPRFVEAPVTTRESLRPSTGSPRAPEIAPTPPPPPSLPEPPSLFTSGTTGRVCNVGGGRSPARW